MSFAVIDRTRRDRVASMLATAVSARPELEPIVELVLGSLDLLERLGARTRGVLVDEPSAIEEFRLILAAAGPVEMSFNGLDDMLREPPTEAVAPQDGIVDMTALVAVGLAAVRVGGMHPYARMSLSTVRALAWAAGPAEMLARLGEAPDPGAIDAVLGAFISARSHETRGIAAALRGFLADPRERARWRGIEHLLGPRGLEALAPLTKNGEATTDPRSADEILLPGVVKLGKLTWDEERSSFVRGGRRTWPTWDAHAGVISGVSEHPEDPGLLVLHGQFGKEKKLHVLFNWTDSSERPVHAGEIVNRSATEITVRVPLDARPGFVAMVSDKRLREANAIRTALRDDLTANTTGLLRDVLWEAWLPDLGIGAMPSIDAQVAYRGGARVMTAPPAAPMEDAAVDDATDSSAVSVVVYRPAVVVVDHEGARIASRRSKATRTSAASGHVVLPWAPDELAVVRGPIGSDEHPAVASMLEHLACEAMRVPGLEHAVWVAIVEEEGDWVATRPCPAARLVAVGTEKGLLRALREQLATPSTRRAAKLETARVVEAAALLPRVRRLRVRGRLRRDLSRIWVEPLREEEREAVDIASKTRSRDKTEFSLLGYDARGRVIVTAPVNARRRGAEVTFEALPQVTDAVRSIVLREAQVGGDNPYHWVRIERPIALPIVDKLHAGSDEDQDEPLPPVPVGLKFDYHHANGARGRFSIEARLAGKNVWVPVDDFVGPATTRKLNLGRLHDADEIRIIASDGWHQASLNRSVEPNAEPAIIRQVEPGLFWADTKSDAIAWIHEGHQLDSEGPLLRIEPRLGGRLELVRENDGSPLDTRELPMKRLVARPSARHIERTRL